MDISVKFLRWEPVVPFFVLCIDRAKAQHTAYAVYEAGGRNIADEAAQSGKASGDNR